MKVYKYVGKNIEGNMIKGLHKANSSEELIVFLKEQNYFLLNYKEKMVRKKVTLFRGKLTYEGISFFSNQLKIVIGAGITILQGLNIINMQCKNQLLKENINAIVSEINHGESLNKSLEKIPHKFPSFFCSMVKVGEESGSLDSALSQISDYYYKEFKLEKKIRSAISYPIFVSVVIFIFTIFSLVKFIPSFAAIFATINSEIPYTTQVIFNISSFTRNNGLLIIFIMIFIAGTIKICSSYFKEYFRELNIIMKIPVIGRVYKEDLDIVIREEDLEISACRASGAGGQHVNKTNSAIRVVHTPTGMVAECQNERSQLQNKLTAISVLKSRIYAMEEEKRDQAE